MVQPSALLWVPTISFYSCTMTIKSILFYSVLFYSSMKMCQSGKSLTLSVAAVIRMSRVDAHSYKSGRWEWVICVRRRSLSSTISQPELSAIFSPASTTWILPAFIPNPDPVLALGPGLYLARSQRQWSMWARDADQLRRQNRQQTGKSIHSAHASRSSSAGFSRNQ